jgi:hypothetical protein
MTDQHLLHKALHLTASHTMPDHWGRGIERITLCMREKGVSGPCPMPGSRCFLASDLEALLAGRGVDVIVHKQ